MTTESHPPHGNNRLTPGNRLLSSFARRQNAIGAESWASIGELMSECRLSQQDVIVGLKEIYSQFKLEFIAGSGIINNRYRFDRDRGAAPAAQDEKPHVEVAPKPVLPAPAVMAQDPCPPATPEPIIATEASVNEHKTRREPAAQDNYHLQRARSGRFKATNGRDLPSGSLPKNEVAEVEPVITTSQTLMVVNLKRRPGSSRVAIALEDAVRIGMEATQAILRSNSKQA